MTTKVQSKNSWKKAKSKKIAKAKKGGKLEMAYREYLAPMPEGRWSSVSDLSQPWGLKTVPTRTAYSSTGE